MQLNIIPDHNHGIRVATWDQVSVVRNGENLKYVKKISLIVEAGDVVQAEVESYVLDDARSDNVTISNGRNFSVQTDRFLVSADSIRNIVLDVMDTGNRYVSSVSYAIPPKQDSKEGKEGSKLDFFE